MCTITQVYINATVHYSKCSLFALQNLMCSTVLRIMFVLHSSRLLTTGEDGFNAFNCQEKNLMVLLIVFIFYSNYLISCVWFWGNIQPGHFFPAVNCKLLAHLGWFGRDFMWNLAKCDKSRKLQRLMGKWAQAFKTGRSLRNVKVGTDWDPQPDRSSITYHIHLDGL